MDRLAEEMKNAGVSPLRRAMKPRGSGRDGVYFFFDRFYEDDWKLRGGATR
jgi:hypothetical protein